MAASSSYRAGPRPRWLRIKTTRSTGSIPRGARCVASHPVADAAFGMRASVTWARKADDSSTANARRTDRASEASLPSSRTPYQITRAYAGRGKAPSSPVDRSKHRCSTTADRSDSVSEATVAGGVGPRNASVRCQPAASVQRRSGADGSLSSFRQPSTVAARSRRRSSGSGTATKSRQRSATIVSAGATVPRVDERQQLGERRDPGDIGSLGVAPVAVDEDALDADCTGAAHVRIEMIADVDDR